MKKYRRIIKNKDSIYQIHEIFILLLIAFIIFSFLLFLLLPIFKQNSFLYTYYKQLKNLFICIVSSSILILILFCISLSKRDVISELDIPIMNKTALKLSYSILKLFNDKYIIDILKLSNNTRFGHEMPNVIVYVSEDLTSGFVAIENIANFEKMDREKYNQKISGIFSGRFKKYAVSSSCLSNADVYMIFNFEDMQTSYRLNIKDDYNSLKEFVHPNKHHIKLSNDLIWKTDDTPHLSIIARTRSGKSVFCGRYMARLMSLQGWTVEYNSAKFDRYVKEFNGKSLGVEIVERAEYWQSVMIERLDKLNQLDKEKYTEIEDMEDVGLFFDELGNLNAELEVDKKLKSRWDNAINKLSATGASAGIHIIAISQFATKEGFLPSLARVNCSDAVIMLGGAANSGDERKYLIPGYDIPERNYGKGQGIARFITSGKKWETPHCFECPWFD